MAWLAFVCGLILPHLLSLYMIMYSGVYDWDDWDCFICRVK